MFKKNKKRTNRQILSCQLLPIYTDKLYTDLLQGILPIPTVYQHSLNEIYKYIYPQEK